MKDNSVYDENSNTEIQDDEINDRHDNDNGNDIEINDNDIEMIDNYESDDEHAASRWTNFANSQSSEDTDYLNQPFPDKLQGRSKLRHSFQGGEGKAEPRDGPKLNQNVKKGILKQALPSVNDSAHARNSINMQHSMNQQNSTNTWNSMNWLNSMNSLDSVNQRISMKPSFLNKNSETARPNHFPATFRGLDILQSKIARRANKENMNWSNGKEGLNKSSKATERDHWESEKSVQLPDRGQARKHDGIGNGERQNNKFGQVKIRSSFFFQLKSLLSM